MALSLAARRARLLAVRSLIDTDGGGAVHLHAGTMAASTEAAADTPPLVIVALAEVSFELHATAAEMALFPALGNVALGGMPTWARFVDGSGVPVVDCTAGAPGTGAQVVVTDNNEPPSAQLYVGGEVNVTATFLEP